MQISPLTATRIFWMRSQRERKPHVLADKLFGASLTLKSGFIAILAVVSRY